MKLVKCQIAKEPEMFFKCPGCFAKLKDTEGTEKGDQVIFLCPKCHRFFNEKGVIPFEEADAMFPGESNIYY
ncbi:MAG: hypothetical protein FWD40_11960 [Treponema sp.]|nr:hypothetical protein [Treponema sp.]